MKNILFYYYNIRAELIKFQDNKYFFTFENNNYCFLPCDNNYNYVNSVFLYLNNYYNLYKIIKNNKNNIVTLFNNNYYVLLKLHNYEFNLNDINNFNKFFLPIEELKLISWKQLWEKKIDHLEYLMNQHGNEYYLLKDSFNYYIGLGENALILLNFISSNYKYSFSHKRINCNFDFYNPFNIIIDVRVRDITDYFKAKFFNDFDINLELNNFLYNNDLTNDEKILFFSRMLFPTYYFDLMEDIIEKNKNENDIKKIVLKTKDYENLLHNIYLAFQNNLYIKWIDEII